MRIKFGNKIIDCEAIAFDKDGTLTNAVTLWWNLYLTRMNLMVNKEGRKVADWWARTSGVDREKIKIDPHGPLASGSHAQEVVILASSIYRVKGRPWQKALQDAGNILDEADRELPVSSYTSTLPGVPEVLLELAEFDLPVAVLTHDNSFRTKEALHYLGLTEAVKCIVTPEDVANMKPAPDMVLLAADRLGVPPGRIAVVGDSLIDMEMAISSGAIPIYVRNGVVDENIGRLCSTTIETISEISIHATQC